MHRTARRYVMSHKVAVSIPDGGHLVFTVDLIISMVPLGAHTDEYGASWGAGT
jgi:hypothetical protein